MSLWSRKYRKLNESDDAAFRIKSYFCPQSFFLSDFTLVFSSMVELRMAEKSDLKEVLKLIQDLATYERAPDEVTVTLREMEEDGFGPNPMFSIVLAEEEGNVLGMAFYYPRYSTWKGKCMYLEDFIVTEASRGKGVGKKLFDFVVEESKKFGAKRLEWQVLDWNEPALSFYRSRGAILDGEWIKGKMTEEMILNYGK